MDELRQGRRIRIRPSSQPEQAALDESDLWVGGEASVGTQARRHVRRSEQHTSGLAFTILGLTFFGGLALGTIVSSLLRQPRGKSAS